MRKFTLLISLATGLGFSGMALAGDPQGQASGHGCSNLNIPFPHEADNPGKMFKAFKNDPGGPFEGLNPKQIAVLAGNITTDKVVEIIKLHCDNSPS